MAASPVSLFEAERQKQYARYAVELSMLGKLMGGVPKSADLIEGWIRSQAGVTDEQEVRRMVLRTLEEQGIEIGDALVQEQVGDALYEAIKLTAEQRAGEQQTTGFKTNEQGVYIEARQVKAMIREAVNIGFAAQRWGPTNKGPKSFTAERVFVYPDEINLGRDEPDGTERVIGHIQDKLGKRSTLGYHEYVERPVVFFTVEVLDNSIKDEWWARVWVIAERNGLGALRSQGYGQFAVTKWDRID